jgi:membrane-bound lytic murein transglycosylase D
LAPAVRAALAIVAAGLAGGCATAPRPAPPPRSISGPTAAAPQARPDARPDLSQARAAYFEGVRAYVAEDAETARERFERCRSAVEAAAGGTPDEEHDAGVLYAKAGYFLAKLDEAAREGAPPEGPPDAAAEAPGGWPLRFAAIEPARNEDVERWINYFTGDGREVFQRWFDRQGRYQPIFEEVFARHGLPPELTYHAMIESGYSTSAYSWAHAVGLWQFIRATGRKYGLRCDWWVDERRDPAKSTEAAARYLVRLYEEFEDWELALAAYNVGEVRIRQQIRRQGTHDFWKLRLPRETRNHVPKFYAAVILGSDPERYGFRRSASVPPETEVVQVDASVDFEVLGECCGGVSSAVLADLNPALVRRATPPDDGGYPVLVPAGTGQRALTALAALPPEKRVRWEHHRVRRGETLSEIAEAYRTTVYAVAQANRLRSVHRLRVGQELMIPSGQKTAGAAPAFARVSGPTTRRKITYVVRRGDTLSEIAERHGTSARRLRSWNRLGRYIHPGQRLTIWQGGSSRSRASDTVVHVRRGDTLWDIARSHGVSLSSLLTANGLTKKSLIRPGDRIRVPRS